MTADVLVPQRIQWTERTSRWRGEQAWASYVKLKLCSREVLDPAKLRERVNDFGHCMHLHHVGELLEFCVRHLTWRVSPL
jgi:hypothetical protein